MLPYLNKCKKDEEKDSKESHEVFPSNFEGQNQNGEPVVEPQQLDKF